MSPPPRRKANFAAPCRKALQGVCINACGSVALSLVQALWSGALAQSYTVTYNDGTVSKSVEMVVTEITENWSSGTVVSVTATFVPADTNVYPTTTE